MSVAAPPIGLLLCEGPDDEAFFKRLIAGRGLPNWVIKHTGKDRKSAGGITNFKGKLQSLEPQGRYPQYLFVADNDDDPTKNFAIVRDQVNAHFGFAPTKPRQKHTKKQALKILMVPWDDVEGNLERLCVAAAESVSSTISAATTTFRHAARVDSWQSEVKRDEMWLRSYLAASCEHDPFVYFRDVFDDPRRQHLIPITHSSFDGVSNELANF